MSDALLHALESGKPLGLKQSAKSTVAFSVNPHCIPAELKAIPRWIVWRNVNGRKTPIDPEYRQPARGTGGSEAWTTFDRAFSVYHAFEFDGLGFGFNGDGVVGLDFDDCRNADGSLERWAMTLLDHVAAYTEVSPSGTGVKAFCLAPGVTFPHGKDAAKLDSKGVPFEVYRSGRWFAVTGQHVQAGPSSPLALVDRAAQVQGVLDAAGKFLERHEAMERLRRENERRATSSGVFNVRTTSSPSIIERARLYLKHNPPAVSGSAGHDVAYHVACVVGWGFAIDSFGDFLAAVNEWNASCQPPWSERELEHKFRSALQATNHDKPRGHLANADRRQDVGQSFGSTPSHQPKSDAANDPPPVPIRTFRELARDFPELRKPVIEGLLREGESMNVIAASKTGKSWLVTSLALSIITGVPWLGTYPTVAGDVLVVDNELHAETLAHRIPKVAEALLIDFDEYADRLHVINLRGFLRDFDGLGQQFATFEPGRFKLIILDAFYRFMPRGADENDNGTMANVYNFLDYHASRLKCGFVCIHHASKGNQADKAVTDVGSGAGSQSRAVDTHLILRPHEETNVAVLDAAVRSWKPIEPICLKWEFPVWKPAPDLDPALLQPSKRRRPEKTNDKDGEGAAGPKKWTVDEFAVKFVSSQPSTEATILGNAVDSGITRRGAKDFLTRALDKGLVFRWKQHRQPDKYATTPQPEEPNLDSDVCSHTHPPRTPRESQKRPRGSGSAREDGKRKAKNEHAGKQNPDAPMVIEIEARSRPADGTQDAGEEAFT